jgi:hypothetical protein
MEARRGSMEAGRSECAATGARRREFRGIIWISGETKRGGTID